MSKKYGITVLGQVDMPLLSNHWQNVLAEAGGQTASVSTSGTFVVANVPVQGGVNALPVTIADDHGNRVTQTVTFAVSEERTMSHDLNGNLTAITSDTSCVEYVWDRENRLVEVLDNGVTVLQCWYDGVGRRLAKREVVNGQTNAVQYLWDGWTVLAVLDGEGRLVEYYTRGLGIAGDIGSLVAETRFTHGATVATYYYHNNHRGDVTAVREGTNTLATVDYRPFGAVRSSTGPFTPRFGFSSKERDRASGLVYFGYRYYSPGLGRWPSRDPIGEAGGLNQHVFCLNSPPNHYDEIGLAFWGIIKMPLKKPPVKLPPGWGLGPPEKSSLTTKEWEELVLDYIANCDDDPGTCPSVQPEVYCLQICYETVGGMGAGAVATCQMHCQDCNFTDPFAK